MNPVHPTVVWLTWRQVFANRRLYLAVLFALAPAAVALMFGSVATDAAAQGRDFYLGMQRELVMGTLLPLSALIFGTTAFGGELDDGTLLYLIVKPIARWRIVLSKYVVAAGSTFVLMLPAVFLPWLALNNEQVPVGIPLSVVWGVAAGAALYGAFFTMLGLVHKNSLIIGLMYTVVFEAVMARRLPGLGTLSIREYANSVWLGMADPALNLGVPPLPADTLWTGGALVLVGATAIAIWRLARFQVMERL